MLNIKNILLKALLLSILLHLIIFNLFGFRLKVKQVAKKPSLNFLGSFLRNYDVEALSLTNTTPGQETLIQKRLNVAVNPKKAYKDNISNTQKSSLAKYMRKSPKKTFSIESTISTDAENKKKASEPKTPEYIQLKLEDNDHY